MTVRQWYLGMAVAAAALMPLSANATLVVPNLENGGNPVTDTGAPAGPGDAMAAKFIGATTETDGIQLTNAFGTSCILGSCAETTWGAGTITTVSDGGLQTWGNTDKSGGTVGASIGFIIYGIADKSVTVTAGVGTHSQTVLNTGANTDGTFGLGDGNIHLDLYYMPSTKDPCFVTTAACASSGNQITSGARTANVGTTAQVTGISNVGTLFAAFTLQPGVNADGGVTLSQSVTIADATGKTTGSGNNANFYAECDGNSPAGAGCNQFNPVTEDSFAPTSFDPSVITQIFGSIGIATAPGASINTGLSSCTALDNCDNSLGWLFTTNDPVNFVAPVPEPASLGLLGTGLALLGLAIHRRRKGISA